MHVELEMTELKLGEDSLKACALSPVSWLSCSVPFLPFSLQRKLPADCKVLKASDLVYTVSAQEYWQQALLTEEETGNLYISYLNH